MKAQKTLDQLSTMFEINKSSNDGLIAKDNHAVIEALNDESVGVEELAGQETWVFSDGSYVTRNGDEYCTETI